LLAAMPDNINSKRESDAIEVKIPQIAPLIITFFPFKMKNCFLLYAVSLLRHNGGIERQPQTARLGANACVRAFAPARRQPRRGCPLE
jgi:hypothetical protein